MAPRAGRLALAVDEDGQAAEEQNRPERRADTYSRLGAGAKTSAVVVVARGLRGCDGS